MLGACFTSVSLANEACSFAKVSFSADFESGRLSQCEHLSDGSYLLITQAENQPINPSPWYYFKVMSKTPDMQQVLKLQIVAQDARPRYPPKRSEDQEQWETMPFEFIAGRMQVSLTLRKEPIYIAAQPPITNQDYTDWLVSRSADSNIELVDIGKSAQGRAIRGLVRRKSSNSEWLLLIGRQHPPELTGAEAMLAFTDFLLTDERIPDAFFQRFNVLAVPNMNPDGVANGNWRHTSKGVDLNRDWGKFTQLESRQLFDFFEQQLKAQQRLVFALDFHSTQQDIFYTMPAEHPSVPDSFSQDWLASLKNSTLSSFTVRQRPGSSPGRGVFKQFIADYYGVQAVTYEVGDNTPVQLNRHVAQMSAKTLAEHMLNTPPDAFVAREKD